MTRSTHTGSGATGPATTFTLALVKRAIVSVRQLMVALKNRRAVNSLFALDDRMLKDIGLTRSDIEGALMTPLTKDPSRHLARLPDEASAEPISAVEHGGERRMLRSRASLASLKSDLSHCA